MSEVDPARRPAPNPAVVVVGSINVDVVARVERHPAPGQTVLGEGGEVLCGGKGANQAVAAAYAGASVALVGAVGDDANADAALVGLRHAGVGLAAVTRDRSPTGIALVVVAADGENTVIVIPGANATIGPKRIAEHRTLLAGARVVVSQGELPVATIDALAAALATAPTVAETSADIETETETETAPATRFVLNLAPVVPVAAATVLLADPLIVNEHEALGALAILDPAAATHGGLDGHGNGENQGNRENQGNSENPGDGENQGDKEDSDRIAVATRLGSALHAAGVRSVVVTIGAAGAVVLSAAGPTHLPAPRSHAVDTTGAGDAFVGACAAALAAGHDLPSAARAAVAFAAASVRYPGTQSSYAAVRAFVD